MRTQLSDESKARFATEACFRALIDEAKHLGLPLDPCLGLIYLPSEETAQQFKDACQAVLDSLSVVRPDAGHEKPGKHGV